MTEVSVKRQIKKLVELQKIDGEIYELKSELSGKPEIIAQFQSAFENSKNKLKSLEETAKSLVLKRKEQELNLKSKEDDISKYKTQLSQVKTNKEYTAKLAEIENVKADQSLIEEKILLSYEESDKITKEIEQERKRVAEQEKNFLTKKREIEDSMGQMEDRVKVLESQRKQIIQDVDKNYLSRYEKILSHKEGLAIAPVRGNTCGGCFMNITHQMINALKMHDQLVECEMCLRILYLEEDL